MEKAIDLLRSKRGSILAIAAKHGAHNVRLFGSLVRGQDRPTSDVDLLVKLDPDKGLTDWIKLMDELADLLGMPVDVVEEDALKGVMKERVLSEATDL